MNIVNLNSICSHHLCSNKDSRHQGRIGYLSRAGDISLLLLAWAEFSAFRCLNLNLCSIPNWIVLLTWLWSPASYASALMSSHLIDNECILPIIYCFCLVKDKPHCYGLLQLVWTDELYWLERNSQYYQLLYHTRLLFLPKEDFHWLSFQWTNIYLKLKVVNWAVGKKKIIYNHSSVDKNGSKQPEIKLLKWEIKLNLILCASNYSSVLATPEVNFIFVATDIKEEENSRLLQMPFQHFVKC